MIKLELNQIKSPRFDDDLDNSSEDDKLNKKL
jgi:hypothetical protein